MQLKCELDSSASCPSNKFGFLSCCRLLKRKRSWIKRGQRRLRRSTTSVKRRPRSAPSWRNSSSRENCLVGPTHCFSSGRRSLLWSLTPASIVHVFCECLVSYPESQICFSLTFCIISFWHFIRLWMTLPHQMLICVSVNTQCARLVCFSECILDENQKSPTHSPDSFEILIIHDWIINKPHWSCRITEHSRVWS